jgi:hypothetical protein
LPLIVNLDGFGLCARPVNSGVMPLPKLTLDTLTKIYDDGGRLVDVSQALFERDPSFVTAVGLRFESVSAIFRAIPGDDTLAVSLGRLVPQPSETAD